MYKQFTLKINNLSYERGGRLLFRDLGFSLSQGEILQITGSNGSGKTTLLRTMCGLLPVQDGEIHWCGENAQNNQNNFRQNVHYLAHNNGLKPDLSVQENLEYYAAVIGIGTEKIATALECLNLDKYKDVLARQLSAGQQRRLAIARLCINPAAIWILDEPFVALDQASQDLFSDLMQEHVNQGGAIIFTSHQKLMNQANIQEVQLTC